MKKVTIGIVISICLLISLLITSVYAEEQNTIINNLAEVPIGSIIMHNGNEFDFNSFGYLINDTRFHLCDGNNGTINLLHSYVACFDGEETDYDTIGETFGNNSYNLTVNQLPSHRHEYIDWYPGFLTQGITNGLSNWCNRVITRNTYTYYTGGNAPIDNRPYTTVVNFIQRVN